MYGRGPLLAIVVTVVSATPALAQKPEADAEFQRGRALVASGDTAGACAAFETSMKLDPLNGTLYNLALCHEKLGKLASAYTEFKSLAEMDTNKRRGKDAADRAAALAPRLTHMRITVAESVAGLVIERDGVDVTALVGKEAPVDPRTYKFEAIAPGLDPVTIDVNLVGEGQIVEVAIPALGSKAVDPVVPDDAYPALLHLRPLVVPNNVVEVAGAGTISDDRDLPRAPIDTAVAARIRIGSFELGALAGSHVRYGDSSDRGNYLLVLGASARYVLNPRFTIGLEYAMLEPLENERTSVLRGLVARKLLLVPKLALEGRAGFQYANREDGYGGAGEFTALGNGRAQVPIIWKVSGELAATLRLNLGGPLIDHTVGLDVAGLLLVAATPQLDVFMSGLVDLLPDSASKSATIGVSWRTR